MSSAKQYEVAVSFNNAAGLQKIIIQPRNASDIQYPAQMDGGDGSVTDVGEQFVELTYTVIEYLDYINVLDQYGLLAASSSEVTHRLRDDMGVFRNYNAIASKKTGKTRGEGPWWANVVILVKGLEQI